MTHPECSEPVKALSDQILSTGQMLKFAKLSDAKQFIIATETGIIHSLKKENPEAEFMPASSKAACPNMKKISLEKILWSLEDMDNLTGAKSQYRVTVPEEIRKKAKRALERMVEVIPSD